MCFPPHAIAAQRRTARQQLVKHDAERKDVAAGIDALAAHHRLLRAHVFKRTNCRAILCELRLLDEPLLRRFRHAKVDYLYDRRTVVQCDHHVGWLDVAMNNPFLMSVLNSLTDRQEQLKSLVRRQLIVVTVGGNRRTVDQFHHKVGTALLRSARVEDTGDVDMVHHGQSLFLDIEASDDLSGVHSRIDHLDRDAALDGANCSAMKTVPIPPSPMTCSNL